MVLLLLLLVWKRPRESSESLFCLHVGDLVGDFELVSDYMFYFLNCLYFALYSGSLVKLEDVVEELLEDSLYFLFLCDEVLDLEFVVT